MKPLIKTVLILSALCAIAFAQGDKPRVAFYFVGEEPREGVFRPLGGQITMAVVKSGEYTAIDRTAELRRLLSDERSYQMSGAVDEGQMSELGKEWGVKYVISIEVTRSIDGFYIEARMVDVEGAYIANMGNFESKLRNSQDVNAAAEKIVADLLGKPAAGGKGGKRAAAPAPSTDSAPKEAKEKADDDFTKKKMMLGAGFALTYPHLSKDGGHMIQSLDDGAWHIFYVYGGGSGISTGLAVSYPITRKLRAGAEINYATSTMDLTEIFDDVYYYDNVEHTLSIPLTLMYNTINPKPVSPFIELGLQSDVILSSTYGYRGPSDLGIIMGAGVTFEMFITAYLGYRCIYNFTKFDRDGYSNTIINHVIGLRILY